MFASVTDVFGGYSQTYQKKIQKLYDDVQDLLKNNAKKLGANAILNMKIDIEEISGQGKQMFLLLANGTAVIIADNISENGETKSTISIEDLIIEINRNKIRKYIIENDNADLSLLEKIIDQYDDKAFLLLLDKLSKSSENSISYMNEEYFAVNSNKIIDQLLNNPEHVEQLVMIYLKSNNNALNKLLFNLFQKNNIIDYKLLYTDIEGKGIEAIAQTIQLLTINKSEYNKNDLDYLKKTVLFLSEIKETVVYSKKKKMLSSQEEDIWNCSCGETNKIDSIKCSSCGKNKYGISSELKNPKEIIDFLQLRISALENYFN